jgi:hypothetical protein
MDKDTEASRGISEALGGIGCAEPIDEEGAQSLVLAVSRVGGLEEDTGEVCLVYWLHW